MSDKPIDWDDAMRKARRDSRQFPSWALNQLPEQNETNAEKPALDLDALEHRFRKAATEANMNRALVARIRELERDERRCESDEAQGYLRVILHRAEKAERERDEALAAIARVRAFIRQEVLGFEDGYNDGWNDALTKMEAALDGDAATKGNR